MIVHWFHLFFLFFLLLFIIVNKTPNKFFYGLIFSSVFYSVSIIDVVSATAYIKYPEIFVLICFFVFCSKHKFNKNLFWSCLFFLFPFFISLIINYYNFNPVEVWQIDPDKRTEWYLKYDLKNSLTITNLTQLIYVAIGVFVFFMTANSWREIDLNKTVRVIKLTSVICATIGLFQILAFYFNVYDTYMVLFYNNINVEYSMLAYHTVLGLKRINATFTEASVFGAYLGFTYFFLLIYFRWNIKSLIFSKSFIYTLFVGLISLSGTFYFSLLLVFFAFLYKSKVIFKLYFLFLSVFAVLISFQFKLIDYLEYFVSLKKASFEERFEFGWLQPISTFIANPYFGIAFGTDRPTTLLFNLLTSIGVFGVIFLSVSFIKIKHPEIVEFLLFWFFIGFLIPDLNIVFMWIYLGLVYVIAVRNKLHKQYRYQF